MEIRPRLCPIEPILELETAIDLLNEAVGAILEGKTELARERLRAANIPAVWRFAKRAMGVTDPAIHRLPASKLRGRTGKTRRIKIPPALRHEIFKGDGWRCRYCGTRVVDPDVKKFMTDCFPDDVPWQELGVGADNFKHAAFYALTAVVDHVVPWAAGGRNGKDNLVTSCQICNNAKNDLLLDEIELEDPRLRVPVIDQWDGLGRVLMSGLATSSVDRPSRAEAAVSVPTRAVGMMSDEWFAALDRLELGLAQRLRDFLTPNKDLGLSWVIRRERLILRWASGEVNLQICAVETNGRIDIPWSIRGHQGPFQRFAEIIAAAVPGATIRKSPAQWNVEKTGRRKLDIRDLLSSPLAFREAIAALDSN